MTTERGGRLAAQTKDQKPKEDHMKYIKRAIRLIAVHLESRSVKKAISCQLQRDDVMTEFEFRRQSALSQ
jgi:hypothetical protein